MTLEQIYRTWSAKVEGWARYFGAERQEVPDVVQDVFLVVARRLPSYVDQNMSGWLWVITKHCVSTKWRTRLVELDEDWDSPATGPNLDAERFLSRVSPRQRQAIELMHLGDLDDYEAARRAGCSPVAMRSRYRNGMDELRQMGSRVLREAA